MIRKQVRFRGRVQGVGFRATTRSIAGGHAVSGWVRNEADGSVLLEAQGEAAAVRAFLEDVAARLSRNIDSADERDAPVAPGEALFEIRR